MSEETNLPYDFAWMQKRRAAQEHIDDLADSNRRLVDLLNEANARCGRYRAKLVSANQEISDLREQLRISRENVKFLQMAVFEEEGNLVQATAETNEPRCDHHTKEQA